MTSKKPSTNALFIAEQVKRLDASEAALVKPYTERIAELEELVKQAWPTMERMKFSAYVAIDGAMGFGEWCARAEALVPEKRP